MATQAQLLLRKYIGMHFYPSSITMENVDTDKVKVTDFKGQSILFTMNIYCDIMDAETKQIYAISNIPHDIENVNSLLPTNWVEVDRYGYKQ